MHEFYVLVHDWMGFAYKIGFFSNKQNSGPFFEWLLRVLCSFAQILILLQFWCFIGSCASVAFILHPVFFGLGLLGTYPWIITNYIWPAIKNILLGLLVVQSLTIVFKVVASIFLVHSQSQRQSLFFSLAFCRLETASSYISGCFPSTT
jgi:hypothetical protein